MTSEQTRLLDGSCTNHITQKVDHDKQQSAEKQQTETTCNNSRLYSNKLYIILFGQTITFSLSIANAASSTLENTYHVRVPTFQTGLVYSMLSLHLVYLFWRERIKGRQETNDGLETNAVCELSEAEMSDEHMANNDTMQQFSIEGSYQSSITSATNATASKKNIKPGYNFPLTSLPLHTPWYTYLLLATLDIEANYLAMLSFQHTSLSSSMLLTSLSVLSTVALRQLIFKNAKYGRKRILGVMLCLIGGCSWLHYEYYASTLGMDDVTMLDSRMLQENDTTTNNTSPSSSSSQYATLYGDGLALSAATLYGLNDVCAEYFIKSSNDSTEYLGMLGFFGMAISFAIQVPLLEKDGVLELIGGTSTTYDSSCNGSIHLLFVVFILMLCYFYTSVMKFLSLYDSTILNLSLQTGPLWAVLLTMVYESMVGDTMDGSGGVGGWKSSVPPVTFFISLLIIIMGMILYESDSEKEENEQLPIDADSKSDRECSTELM